MNKARYTLEPPDPSAMLRLPHSVLAIDGGCGVPGEESQQDSHAAEVVECGYAAAGAEATLLREYLTGGFEVETFPSMPLQPGGGTGRGWLAVLDWLKWLGWLGWGMC